MSLQKSFVPYGCYFSSPFCRWQGSLGSHNSIELAAGVTRGFLEDRQLDPEVLESLVLGYTVPQRHSFYGAPWLAGMIGAPGISGQMVGQACATSARIVANAALEVEAGLRAAVLTVACDRTSNGPHIYYPDPKGVGGRGQAEEPVWDNFNKDPWAGQAMIQTAENVAAEAGITRQQQDALTLRRDEQYRAALADDGAFQRRYMMPVQIPLGRKKVKEVAADEGIFPTEAEGLARLRPVLPDGTVTFGSQTYPADGNAGMVICDAERANELSKDKAHTIQVISFGEARVAKGMMPTAVVPAAQQALSRADIDVSQCAAIKTHNPFAVNDLYFAKEMGVDAETMNNYGSPLIYGHPQGPTGLRVMAELIEELCAGSGGFGLFSGCAAGDTAMAVVLKVY